MDKILGIVLFVLVSGSALIAMLAAVALLFPSPVERTRTAIETSLGRSFLLGLVNFLFFGAIAALVARLGQRAGGVLAAVLMLIALLLLIVLAVFSLLGLTALTALVGERIGEGTSPFRRHLRGSLLLTLAGLTPYVGWFLFSPIVVMTSLGAGLQSLFRKKGNVAAEKTG